jgi:hypothetical protein
MHEKREGLLISNALPALGAHAQGKHVPTNVIPILKRKQSLDTECGAWHYKHEYKNIHVYNAMQFTSGGHHVF